MAAKTSDGGVITVRTILTGTTALLMHSERLADSSNEWTKKIKAITAKKANQTEEDHAKVEQLEWRGGLYADNGKVVVPKANILKCVATGSIGVAKGRGPTIFRAVSPASPEVFTPLIFPGDGLDLEELYQPKYIDRSTICNSGPGKTRVVRIRPRFDGWGLSVDWLLITSLLDPDQFESYVKMAGRIEGLGDKRIKGMGRFDVKVIKVGGVS